MKYSDLNFDSIKKLNKKEFILVPMGSMEVHGPNLPLGSDLYIAEAFACLIEKKISSIIMPSISYGYANITKNIFGTISIDFSILASYIYNIINNLINLGFEKIIIISIHKDNDLTIKLALTKIFEETNMPVLYINPYNDFSKFDELVFSIQDNSYKETSLILASLELLNKKEIVGEIRFPDHKYKKPYFLKNLLDIGYIRYKYINEMEHINPEKKASAEEGMKYMNEAVKEIVGKIDCLEDYINFLKERKKNEL